MKKNEENNNCSFHTTEMNNQEEAINENELGEWKILFRLDSVEDLEKIFESSKKIDIPLVIGLSAKHDKESGENK
jgi:hypothetical protein